MGFLAEDVLFGFHSKRSREEALRLALAPDKSVREPEPSPEERVRPLGAVPGAIPYGLLSNGAPLLLPSSIANSGITAGASGTGKTRHILNRIDTELRWNLGLSAHGVAPPLGYESETELLDSKTETSDEAKKVAGALYAVSADPERERLRRFIRVFGWSATRVTPLSLFHNGDRTVSDAFLAHQRVEVEAAASSQTFTDSVKHVYFMLGRHLTAKDYPLNFLYGRRFLTDRSFRLRELSGVADRDLVAYFATLDETVPKQTIDALLRRLQHALSFPEIRAAVSMPHAEIARLLPPLTPRLTIGDFGLDNRLPRGKAIERAVNRILDILRALPRRNPTTPYLLILEEAGYLLSQAKELSEPLANASRTLRHLNASVHFVAQDFVNALEKPLVRTLTLNARSITLFQSREEAEWLTPFANELSGLTGTATQRRAALVREIQNLPARNAYLWVKGMSPVRFTTLPCPSASERAGGMPEEELREIFEKEIAPASTIPVSVAEEAIARWEAEVVGPLVTPSDIPRRPAGIADLLSDLDEDEDPS